MGYVIKIGMNCIDVCQMVGKDKDQLIVGKPDQTETVSLSKWALDGPGPNLVWSCLCIGSWTELKKR